MLISLVHANKLSGMQMLNVVSLCVPPYDMEFRRLYDDASWRVLLSARQRVSSRISRPVSLGICVSVSVSPHLAAAAARAMTRHRVADEIPRSHTGPPCRRISRKHCYPRPSRPCPRLNA